jgi:hypothetical protein
MGQTQFTVIPDPIGTYTVEVREPNGTVRRIDGFPNEDRTNLRIRDRRQKEESHAWGLGPNRPLTKNPRASTRGRTNYLAAGLPSHCSRDERPD